MMFVSWNPPSFAPVPGQAAETTSTERVPISGVLMVTTFES